MPGTFCTVGAAASAKHRRGSHDDDDNQVDAERTATTRDGAARAACIVVTATLRDIKRKAKRFIVASVFQNQPMSSGRNLNQLRRAAERGDTTAMNELGAAHRNGVGVPVDLAAAADWFRRAADANCPFGMINLSILLREGASETSFFFLFFFSFVTW